MERLEAEKSALLDYVQEAEAVKQGHEKQLAQMQEAAESIGFRAAAAANAKTKAAEAESNKLREEVRALTKEMEELKNSKELAHNEGNSESIITERERYEKLSASYDQKVRELEEITGMQTDLVNMVQEANTERESQKTLITELQGTLVELQGKYGSNHDGMKMELEKIHESHDGEIVRLQKQLEEMQAEKELVLRDNIKGKLYEDEIKTLRAQVEEKTGIIEDMDAKIKAMQENPIAEVAVENAGEEDMRAMQAALDKAQKSVEEALSMKQELAAKRKELTSMELVVSDAGQKILMAEKESEGFKKEAAEMRTLMGQHHADMLQNAQRAHEAEGKVAALEMAARVSDETNKRLTETLEQFQQSSAVERKALSMQMEGLKSNGGQPTGSDSVTTNENDVGTLHATNEALQGTIADLASQMYELREQLEVAESSHPNLEGELETQKRQLVAQNEEIRFLTEKHTALEKEEARLQEIVKELKTMVSEETSGKSKKLEHKLSVMMAECESLRSSLELSEMARKLAKEEMGKAKQEAEKEKLEKEEVLTELKERRAECELMRQPIRMEGPSHEYEPQIYTRTIQTEAPSERRVLHTRPHNAVENRIVSAPRVTPDVGEEAFARRAGDLLGRLRSKRKDAVQPLASSGVNTPGASDPQERFDAYARAKSLEDRNWMVSDKSRFLPTEEAPEEVSQGSEEIDHGAFITHDSVIEKRGDDAMERKIAGFEEKFATLRRNAIEKGSFTFAA